MTPWPRLNVIDRANAMFTNAAYVGDGFDPSYLRDQQKLVNEPGYSVSAAWWGLPHCPRACTPPRFRRFLGIAVNNAVVPLDPRDRNNSRSSGDNMSHGSTNAASSRAGNLASAPARSRARRHRHRGGRSASPADNDRGIRNAST